MKMEARLIIEADEDQLKQLIFDIPNQQFHQILTERELHKVTSSPSRERKKKKEFEKKNTGEEMDTPNKQAFR